MTSIRVARLYADADGESHFDELVLDAPLQETSTGVAAHVTAVLGVEDLAIRDVVRESSAQTPHVAPYPLLLVNLSGTVEVTASDGETRRFGPGDIVVLHDIHGKGHITRNVGSEARRTLVGTLKGDAPACSRST